MAARRNPDRINAIDAELIEQTTRSKGWQLIEQRIEETIAAKMRELTKTQTEIETATLRGFIAGLQLAAGVPKILRQEAKETTEQAKGR